MVNIAKPKYGKKPRSGSLFSFKSNDLEMVQAYKYLGVWITTNGNYIKAQQAQANQGKKAIFALQRLLAKFKAPSHYHCTEAL